MSTELKMYISITRVISLTFLKSSHVSIVSFFPTHEQIVDYISEKYTKWNKGEEFDLGEYFGV